MPDTAGAPLVEFDPAYYRGMSVNRERGYDRLGDAYWRERRSRERDARFGRLVMDEFVLPADRELYASLIAAHGLFAEPFFRNAVRQRIAARFGQVVTDLESFSRSVAEALERPWMGRVPNVSDAMLDVLNQACELLHDEVLQKAEVSAELSRWIDEFSKGRKCALCGQGFRVVDLPYWIYFGSNARQDCCFQCGIVASPSKKELPTLIRSFVDQCGFVPSSNATPRTYSFTSRLAPDRWNDAMRAYGKMGGIDHVKQVCDSWFTGLASSGALPGGVQATARGIRCLATDGHVCNSLEEQEIDNWLSAHGIAHTKEPMYPPHNVFNPKGKRRADWQVEGTLIEFFGLVGDPRYDAKRDDKVALASALGLDLLAVYPADLWNIDELLSAHLPPGRLRGTPG